MGGLLLTLLLAACTGPLPAQLGLGGDRECSSSPDISLRACNEHDTCYWAGGTEQDRHVCDAEFLADLLIDGVDYETAWIYYRFVHRFGSEHFTYRKQRTRGPPK